MISQIKIFFSLSYAAKTDVGLVRQENQDNYGIFPNDSLEIYDEKGVMFIVADGMGGHNAGEVASGIAANVIYEQLRAILPEINTGEEDKESGYALESIAIKSAIEQFLT